MKKLQIVLVGLLGATVACTSSNDNSEANDNQAEIVVDTFYTPDRAFAELRGPVKECKVTTKDLEKSDSGLVLSSMATITTRIERFNQQGAITDVISNVVFEGENVESMSYTFDYDSIGNLRRGSTSMEGTLLVRRDAAGYVSSFASIGTAGDREFVKAYSWQGPLLMSDRIINNDNNDDSDVGNKTTYSYDEQGYRTASQEVFGDPQISVITTDTKYDNKKFDKHGNWTERIVTKTAKRTDISASGKRTEAEPESSYLMETREITYY